MIGLISSPCLHHVFYVLIRVHSTLIFSSLKKDWALYIYKKWLSEGKQIKSNASGCEVISMEWVCECSTFEQQPSALSLVWIGSRWGRLSPAAGLGSPPGCSPAERRCRPMPASSPALPATETPQYGQRWVTLLHFMNSLHVYKPLCNVYSNVPFYFALDQNSSN